MSEKIVSPGVFTKESDLSYLPQGIAQIGAAIIGPTAKGPAFIPTLVESYSDFTRTFGDADGLSYVPYTVRNYLKHSGRATIVRVVNIQGYESDTVKLLAESPSGSGTFNLIAMLAPTQSANTPNVKITYSPISTDTSAIIISGSGFVLELSASLDPSKDRYITNLLGTSPNGTYPLYVYNDFSEYATSLVGAIGDVSQSILTTGLDLSSSLAYDIPATPWIQSQLGTNLFKLHHFNAGASDVYVSIENIKFGSEVAGTDFGTFTLLVRQIGDTDLKPVVLESFATVNLDPDSVNFIGRRIGDQYRETIEDSEGNPKVAVYGDFTNKSKYIRVEMSTDSHGAVEVPFGFDSYYEPVSISSGYRIVNRLVQKSDTDLVTNALITADSSSFNTKYYLGFNQDYSDNLFVLKPLADNSVAVATSSFSLNNAYVQTGGSTSVNSALWSAYADASGSTNIPSKFRKFSVALQGGFDGFDPTIIKAVGADISATNVFGFDCNTPYSPGTLSYRKAIDTIANPDEFDINMLVLPGILNEFHPNVVTYANDMTEERGDVFFLFDNSELARSVSDTITDVEGIDSNYSATYYPWVKIYDNDNTKYMWVPPTVVMTAVIAFTDKVAAPWYAPAGLNRGGIPEALQAYTRLTQSERDELYEGRVNPIVAFIGQGIVAWGQKTLQVKASALDRINVRRLLIELKKYIASATKYLVFEQNTNATRTRFLNIVNPYLDSVQQKQGLYTFKVVMDETNNTPDVIDRNMMVGAIYLQPAKTAEMIVIDFNITPSGAVFGQ